MTWEDKYTVKMGDYGEWLVDEELIRRGFTIYKPITKNAHPFDRLVYSKYDSNQCNHEGFILEIKTKPRRMMYADTGIDVKLFNHYRELSERNKLKLFIMFVDYVEKQIYGTWLKDLETPEMGYPLKERTKGGKWVIYFPLNKMKVFKQLTDEEIENIKKYNQSKYW